MATISKVQDLLPLLGSVATADDPIAALEKGGHHLSPALKASLPPRRSPTPAQRQLWNKAAGKAGKLTFTAGQHPRLKARPLAPGEFEFSAGIRMDVANKILAGLHAAGTIPDAIFLDELLSSGDRDALQAELHVDRPGGRIGSFLIANPPILAPIGDGLDHVALTIPFRLNLERIFTFMSNEVRNVVTFATGRLRLSVGLVTKSVTVSAGARNLEIQIDLSSSFDARLELDKASPVQLAAPGSANILAGLLQNAIRARLAGSLRFTVSAAIPLPIGALEISQTALVTRGDAILVGLKVRGIPGNGNPDSLTALFPDAQTNFFMRVHDSVLRLIVQNAARSGELTSIAKQTHPDVVIDSADVSFGANTIKLLTTGKVVNLCLLGDVGFTNVTTITITLDGAGISIQKEDNRDLDNIDVALCAVTSLGLALLAALRLIVFQGLSNGLGIIAFGFLGVLSLIMEFDGDAFVLGGGDDGKSRLIDLDFPFPGTDLLPTLTGMFMRLDESTMLMAAHLGTGPDVLNTYFYVRFLENDTLGIAHPMKNVRVNLMDRDSPAPAGDDVTLPGPSTTQTSHHTPGGDILTTTKIHFERTADETVRGVTTDHTGRIRIYIPRGKLASKAGDKVAEITRLNVDTDQETTGTSRTPFPEERPDFYFRITRPDGTIADTVQMPSGFLLNFQSARVGTRPNPLTFTFGAGSVVFAPVHQ